MADAPGRGVRKCASSGAECAGFPILQPVHAQTRQSTQGTVRGWLIALNGETARPLRRGRDGSSRQNPRRTVRVNRFADGFGHLLGSRRHIERKMGLTRSGRRRFIAVKKPDRRSDRRTCERRDDGQQHDGRYERSGKTERGDHGAEYVDPSPSFPVAAYAVEFPSTAFQHPHQKGPRPGPVLGLIPG